MNALARHHHRTAYEHLWAAQRMKKFIARNPQRYDVPIVHDRIAERVRLARKHHHLSLQAQRTA